MIKIIKILAYSSAFYGVALFLRPVDNSLRIFLWVPKLFAAALSPLMLISGILGAMMGALRGDRKLAGAGILGAGLSAKFIKDLPNSEHQFKKTFGSEQIDGKDKQNYTTGNKFRKQSVRREIDFQRNIICGENPQTASPLLADLWQPGGETSRSGFGIVYAHGSGWRVGDKDMLTRYFFRRLVAQGHVVLDIAYSLWPQCDMPTMVAEFNQAILWMKENSATLKVNPRRIVAMGGSAGGHLALLAAYATQQLEFQPFPESGDTSVRGVVAFYPPVDLLEIYSQTKAKAKTHPSKLDNVAQGMMKRIFMLYPEKSKGNENGDQGMSHMFPEMLGGTPDEVPEAYRLLSPIQHVGSHCPPTLLLQGSDDVFDLAPGVRRLHHDLQAAGATSILVEYPHTEHGFDLLFPQISPVAQAATEEVERFLTLIN
jgi:acetyl esterase/lipase